MNRSKYLIMYTFLILILNGCYSNQDYLNSYNPPYNNNTSSISDIAIQIFMAEQSHNYTEAINLYEVLLSDYELAGNKQQMGNTHRSIGTLYRKMQEFEQAFTHFDSSISLLTKAGSTSGVARTQMELAYTHQLLDRFDIALILYKKALDILTNPQIEPSMNDLFIKDVIRIHNNISNIYTDTGRYHDAESELETALQLTTTYFEKEKENSMNPNRAAGAYITYALQYMYNGKLYNRWGYEENNIALLTKALDNYREAENILLWLSSTDGKNENSPMADTRGLLCNNYSEQGIVLRRLKRYNEAIPIYNEAMQLAIEVNNQDMQMSIYNNLGVLYFYSMKYGEAQDNFHKSIELCETLRLRTAGKDRRDYLESQIKTYKLLISALIRDGKYKEAFNTIELSSARFLAEQISGESIATIEPVTAESVMNTISNDTTLLSYTHVDFLKKVYLVMIEKGKIKAIEIDTETGLKRFNPGSLHSFQASLIKKRGSRLKTKRIIRKIRKTSFTDLLQIYRLILASPHTAVRGLNLEQNSETLSFPLFSNYLYRQFVKPVEKNLAKKKRLIIMPGDEFAYIPFETLLKDNNHYLIESFDIHYTQSMTVHNMLKNRTYPDTRNNLLAFGGPTYKTSDAKTKQEETTFEYARILASRSLTDPDHVSSVYKMIGLQNWSELPGTLEEVEQIEKCFSDSRIFTGDQASEQQVLQLNKKGELKKYRFIHFACHGLVIPEIPELSALVLTQDGKNNRTTDGYLTMGEIQKLNIKADVVTLSACETGLGKLYSGEGMVGLTQSFLTAGANGVCVSLWQVADKSTRDFMTDVYQLMKSEGISYHDATAATKRSFIKDTHYSSPFYWAPFVYYGI